MSMYSPFENSYGYLPVPSAFFAVILFFACSGEQNEDFVSGEHEMLTANRTIDLLPEDIAGNKTILDWNEAILSAIEQQQIQVFSDPAMREPLDYEQVSASMQFSESITYAPDPVKPHIRKDSTIIHEMKAENIGSYQIADSVAFQDDLRSYSAKIVGIAPVIELDRHPRDPGRQVVCWIPWSEMENHFGKEAVSGLNNYIFEWFNPNP